MPATELDLNRLHEQREELAHIASVSSAAELSAELRKLSQGVQRSIVQIVEADDSNWNEFVTSLQSSDRDLAVVAGTIREKIRATMDSVGSEDPFDLSSRVLGLMASPYFGLESGGAIIRFALKTGDGRSLVSDQDLEDSLWLGATVLDSVARATHLMLERYQISADRLIWGEEFESRLGLAEEAVRMLRRLYDQRHESGKEEEGSAKCDA